MEVYPTRHDAAARYPGEWIAIAEGRIIAHGLDLHEVAEEACTKAHDIVFELVPDPGLRFPQPVLYADDRLATPALPTGRRRLREPAHPPRPAAPPPR